MTTKTQKMIRKSGYLAAFCAVVGIFAAALVRLEGAISDATHKKSFAPCRQELAVDKCSTSKGWRKRGEGARSL